MLVDGKVCGVVMLGDLSNNEYENIQKTTQAITNLQNCLADMFGEAMAKQIVSQLGETHVTIHEGNVSNNGKDLPLQVLFRSGLISASASTKERLNRLPLRNTNRPMIERRNILQ